MCGEVNSICTFVRMEAGGMDVTRTLGCRVTVVNRQGGVIEDFSKGLITVRNKKSTPLKKSFSIFRTSSDIKFRAKYNLIGNIEQLFTRFLNEGQATVSLKEPSYDIIITNAKQKKLTEFIVFLKKFVPKNSPVHVSMAASEPPIHRISLFLDDQRNYKLWMENIIGTNTNLAHFIHLKINDCTLELEGYQVPIAGAIRKMKNLTTLLLEVIKLRSSIFLEIESKELKQLHLCLCETPLPIASLFKNDLCYKDSLVELYLEGNNWTEVPNGIFQFRNLLELSLGANCLTHLPDKFTNLPNLETLLLNENKLRYLPPSIFALQNLFMLYLSNNLITELPDKFNNLPKLETLLLCDNQLSSLPPSIFALQNLSSLYLSDNLITELPDKFNNLPKLKHLSLSNNQLKCLPLSILSVNLKTFDVTSNPYNFGFTPSFGSEMYLPSLKELSYRAILKHKLKVKEGMLPKRFLKDLENHHQCICGCKFVDGQKVSFSCNLKNIGGYFINHTGVRHYPRIPISGHVCNDLKLCFPLGSRFIEV